MKGFLSLLRCFWNDLLEDRWEMKIIENTAEFHIEAETAVAIGKFDGFHRGHQKLLGQLKRQQEKGLRSVVFTFVPSPAAFSAGSRSGSFPP